MEKVFQAIYKDNEVIRRKPAYLSEYSSSYILAQITVMLFMFD